MVNLFLSPSVQERNIGLVNYGTEEYRMNLIADVVQNELVKHKNIQIFRNKVTDDANAIIKASNGCKSDYHFAFHSNAANGQARGCEVFAYLDGTENNSVKLSRIVYNKIAALTPTADRGVKDGRHLFEVGDQIIAASCLVEIAFHDNAEDANFIINHIEKIGEALAQAFLEHLTNCGVDVGLINPEPIKPEVIKEIVYVDVPGPEVIKYVDVPGPERIVYQDKIVMREPSTSECFQIIFRNMLNKINKRR